MSNKKGIDVSVHNGVIDFSKVKASGIQFVIIRGGYGNSYSQKDKNFDYNIKNAIANGFDLGIYWFSYAISVEDALKEWSVCKQIIDPYKDKINMFVAFDYEGDSKSYYKKVKGIYPTNTLINQMAVAFMDAVKKDGYTPAIYFNNDYAKNVYTADTLSHGDKWLADYNGAPNVPCDIQQTRSDGKIDGISTLVDVNVCYKDYSELTDDSFQCDTTCDFNINKGASYQFKITAKKQPVFAVGTDGVFTSTFIKQEGNNYFYKITAVGTEGKSAGIYVNGHKVCVASITQSIPSTKVDIDTTADVMMDYGSYYIVKTTSPTPVKLTYGTSNVVSIVPFPRTGNEQLFAIVSIGKSGAETGIYTCTDNEQPLKRFKFKVK